MSDKPKDDNNKEPKDTGRRDFLKVAGAAAAAAETVGAGNTASADSFQDTAERYMPPGQWWHHTGLEWYEFPSDDPKVTQVFG